MGNFHSQDFMDPGFTESKPKVALDYAESSINRVARRPGDRRQVDPCRRSARVETANTILNGCEGSTATVARDLSNPWQCEADIEVRCRRAIVDEQLRFRGVQILLVEDNDVSREIALCMLRHAGVVVSVACDGQEALDMLSRQRFDGVLMDCQMPVLDGYAATRVLRGQAQWLDLPVIALTASTMAEDRDKALAAGMNDHIAKPINLARLFATLARWVRPRTAEFGKTSALADAGICDVPLRY